MAANLHDKHRHELEVGSGISPEIIATRGAYTATTQAELQALGFADYQALAPALVLPIHSLNGCEPVYAIKPDNPRTPAGKDKPLKYEYPAGAANRLDCPPATRAILDDPSVPLLWTEGWKKVMKATTERYHCIGIGGVWNWLSRHDTPCSMPLEDFGYINSKGRKEAIVFDSDVATNPNVREARRRFGLFRQSLGARVYYIDIPPAPDGSKQGLDDFLVSNPGVNLWDMAYEPVDDRLAAMQRKLDDLQRDLDDLREEYKWSHDLDSVSNKALSPGDKLVLRDIRRATRAAGAAAYRDPQTLYYGERVKHTGQSTSAYSRSVQQLEAAGAVKVIEGKYESGKPKVSVVLNDTFKEPAKLQRATERASGGARPRNVPVCTDCGPETGVRESKASVTRYHCAGCGDLLHEIEHETGKPEQLVRSGIEPTECVSVEAPPETEQPTVANLQRKGKVETEAPRLTLHCKNETVPEPPPLEEGYTEALLAAIPNLQRSQEGMGQDAPYPPQVLLLSSTLDDKDMPEPVTVSNLQRTPPHEEGTKPPCNSRYGECLQPGYCAKLGRCRWTPAAHKEGS